MAEELSMGKQKTKKKKKKKTKDFTDYSFEQSQAPVDGSQEAEKRELPGHEEIHVGDDVLGDDPPEGLEFLWR